MVLAWVRSSFFSRSVIASPDLSGRGNLYTQQPHKIASSLPFLAMTEKWR
jgi:hypothetical protein